jgi:ATP-dependent helicase/nuclease subunit A
MNTALSALSPQHSITVTASAGSGKTWLLVTRLARLLMEGTAPDAILAITFTRKAAAEMAARLRQRLYDLARADDSERARLLKEMDVEPTAEHLRTAALLYERHLFDMRQVRVTTFHAFCQELLRRFPLEADVPAGFDVLEAPRQLQEEAWGALEDEATRAPDGGLARDLETLFNTLNDPQEAKAALLRFLHHRSDWWAYVRGRGDPAAYATAQLVTQLQIDPDADPLPGFFTEAICADLAEFAALLARHATATNRKHADCIERVLDAQRPNDERLTDLKAAFFTQKGERLQRKGSKAAQDSLGAAGLERWLALHDALCGRIETLLDTLRRRATLNLSRAWYRAGTRLLDHYQRLKAEQRILDFSDLEWKAFLLLNHADHALWVQYKLDRRIDHLLIDEFQDTNPTQWHLIFPLLQELAAGGGGRQRSVFVVGDAKQSIYRFRRAEPALFPAAQRWLRERLQAVDHALSASRRSSPAVIEFVNQIFGAGPLHDLLPEFTPHTTHHRDLWGGVELLPLITADEDEQEEPPSGLRNPLQRPRPESTDRRHQREGAQIAARILALMAQPMRVMGEASQVRPLRRDDVMILVRNRTHVQAYEEALRAAGIPYVTASRGTLLDCLEIGDLVALLETLILPYNNLSLAQVLRSPLFACHDEDLMRLAAEPGGHWWDRLLAVGSHCAAGSPLARAAVLLPRWQELAGQRPVHDLLDRIYSEGNVMARYQAAFPAHLRPRARANLTRFIELALDMDSGRYPSLTAFLNRLKTLKSLEEDAPDEAAENTAGSVRLLTIHAAKGLEAAVVFLADAAAAAPTHRGARSIVRWPAEYDRPSHFLLCARAAEADKICTELLDEEARQAAREQANLLYVAVTRAKQQLFISGCETKRSSDLGWYGTIAARLGNPDTLRQEGWRNTFGSPPPFSVSSPVPAPAEVTPPEGLSAPPALRPTDTEISPSRRAEDTGEGTGSAEGRERGLAIHRFLQLLCEGGDEDAALRRVCRELNRDEADPATAGWLAEARRVITDPGLRDWFDPAHYDRAFNEVPVCYEIDGRMVYGMVDRLVVKGNECVLLDYKTHRNATADKLQAMAAPYGEQMRLYIEGVRRLWPEKRLRAYVLFTACAGCIEFG